MRTRHEQPPTPRERLAHAEAAFTAASAAESAAEAALDASPSQEAAKALVAAQDGVRAAVALVHSARRVLAAAEAAEQARQREALQAEAEAIRAELARPAVLADAAALHEAEADAIVRAVELRVEQRLLAAQLRQRASRLAVVLTELGEGQGPGGITIGADGVARTAPPPPDSAVSVVTDGTIVRAILRARFNALALDDPRREHLRPFVEADR